MGATWNITPPIVADISERISLRAYALSDCIVTSEAPYYYFKCTTAGTTGAVAPTWDTENPVSDGTVVWTYGGTVPIKKIHIWLTMFIHIGMGERKVTQVLHVVLLLRLQVGF